VADNDTGDFSIEWSGPTDLDAMGDRKWHPATDSDAVMILKVALSVFWEKSRQG